MNTLPTGSQVFEESEVETPQVNTVEETLSQPETSNDENTKGRGRPKGIRNPKVVQQDISYKLTQIEKQKSRHNTFLDQMNVCKDKITGFQNEIEELTSQLETSQD